MGLVWDCHAHTVPSHHTISLYGYSLDFYEIRSFPIESNNTGQCVGMIWAVMCHIKTLPKPYMDHRLSHIRSIVGPYMPHTTQFGKGNDNYCKGGVESTF